METVAINGYVNGNHGYEHTNGKVNGYANGDANGDVNGHCDELSNGGADLIANLKAKISLNNVQNDNNEVCAIQTEEVKIEQLTSKVVNEETNNITDTNTMVITTTTTNTDVGANDVFETLKQDVTVNSKSVETPIPVVSTVEAAITEAMTDTPVIDETPVVITNNDAVVDLPETVTNEKEKKKKKSKKEKKKENNDTNVTEDGTVDGDLKKRKESIVVRIKRAFTLGRGDSKSFDVTQPQTTSANDNACVTANDTNPEIENVANGDVKAQEGTVNEVNIEQQDKEAVNVVSTQQTENVEASTEVTPQVVAPNEEEKTEKKKKEKKTKKEKNKENNDNTATSTQDTTVDVKRKESIGVKIKRAFTLNRGDKKKTIEQQANGNGIVTADANAPVIENGEVKVIENNTAVVTEGTPELKENENNSTTTPAPVELNDAIENKEVTVTATAITNTEQIATETTTTTTNQDKHIHNCTIA